MEGDSVLKSNIYIPYLIGYNSLELVRKGFHNEDC